MELLPAQQHEVLEENATVGWPPSLNGDAHARSSSPASRNSPGRVRLAKKAARAIYSGIPQDQDGRRHSRESSHKPFPLHLQPCAEKSGEKPEGRPVSVPIERNLADRTTNLEAVVPGDDGKKAGMSFTNLTRRLRKIGRRSGVRDAPSWHQPLDNGSDKGGKKFKGVAPPRPVYYPPYNKYGRRSDVGSTHFMEHDYSRSSAPSPEERPRHLGGVGRGYDDEGYPIPRYPLARQTSSYATHLPTNQPHPSKHNVCELSEDSTPPTKRPRLYSLTHRWARTANINPPLSTHHTASTDGSPKSAVSKAFNALLAKGRGSSEASGSSPSMESSQPSFQHIERASTSTKD